MNKTFWKISSLILLLPINSLAQKQKPVPSCSQTTFAVLKQLPKLEYECPDSPNDSDDAILKLPGRISGLKHVMNELERFDQAAWWQASVDELSACQLHGKAGRLSEEEQHQWQSGDVQFYLFGTHEMRLVQIMDPCYSTGYSGSNIFLLYHKAGKVFVSQLINGYYSRVDNSVGLDVALLNGRQIVEVSTANSMPPSLLNYYFEIDPATNKAVPKNIFKERGKFTNQVYSDMLMDNPKSLGLPKDASELNVIRNGRMSPSFSAYEEGEGGKIDANGRNLRRIIYTWNGKFYARGR